MLHTARSVSPVTWRRAPLLASALLAPTLLIAGCTSGQPSAEKVEGPRATVALEPPAAGPAPSRDTPVEPALGPNRLRAADPCELLDSGLMSRGSPRGTEAEGFSGCASRVHGPAGGDLRVTLRLGAASNDSNAQSGSDHRVAGLATRITTGDGQCRVRGTVQRGPHPLGIAVRVRGNAPDPCSPGIEVLSTTVSALRSAPPKPPPESLGSRDPCAVPSDAVAAGVGSAPPGVPDGLHACSWHGDGTIARVEFRPAGSSDGASASASAPASAPDPAPPPPDEPGTPPPGTPPSDEPGTRPGTPPPGEPGTPPPSDAPTPPPGTPPPPAIPPGPVDLGGVTAQVHPVAGDHPRCRISWPQGRPGQSVRLSVDGPPGASMDPCAAGLKLAGGVRGVLR